MVSGAQWEARVVRSPELEARGVEAGIRSLAAGDRAGALAAYRACAAGKFRHSLSWTNLAALGIGLQDMAGARAHAKRALELDRGNPDAWVNLGVASWPLGLRRDAAQAMHQALLHAPGLATAALNYARMLQLVERPQEARRTLELAALANPAEARLPLAIAELARTQCDHPAVRREALRALRLAMAAADLRRPARSGLRADSGLDLQAALVAACDRLESLEVAYHLMAGTLLGIAKDGRLFPHDKDVDLALPDLDASAIEALRLAFSGDADYRMFPTGPAGGGRASVVGLLHAPTGVGIDLVLPLRDGDGRMRNAMGWPDQLVSVLRPYAIGRLHWNGRDWPVPVPTEQYLEDMYGADWREQVRTDAGVAWDRCYADTMVSNASRTAESIPRAVNLGLLRLVHALAGGEWNKAVAYCAQLLAREELPEVRHALVRLQAAGHTGMRVDG